LAVLFRFFVVALVAVGAIGFIISEVFKFSNSIFGFNRRLVSDIKSLRKSIESREVELIPFDKNELKILNGNTSNSVKRNRFDGHMTALVKTIYDETIATIGLKTYPESKQGVLVAKQNFGEYVFVQKKAQLKIYLDGKHQMNFDGTQMMDKENRNQLLRSEKLSNSLVKIYKADKHIASLDLQESESEFSNYLSYCNTSDDNENRLVYLMALISMFDLS